MSTLLELSEGSRSCKVDDTPTLTATCRRRNAVGASTVVDLTGSTVVLRALNVYTGELKVSSPAVFVDATGGVISRAWIADDTDTPADLAISAVVTFGGGAIETFPSNRGPIFRVNKSTA